MGSSRLPPEVSRILFVKNLPFQTSGDELYALFGRFGAIRQIRLGDSKQTRGSAFVVFEHVLDAKDALENMKGFKAGDRYMSVLYYAGAKKAPNGNGQQVEEAQQVENSGSRRKARLGV